MCNHFGVYTSTGTDVGVYLVIWTLLTLIFGAASLFIHKAMTFTFAWLIIGFIFLDLAHFGYPELKSIAAYALIICALSAWYMMATIIINDVAGKEILKSGKPFLKKA